LAGPRVYTYRELLRTIAASACRSLKGSTRWRASVTTDGYVAMNIAVEAIAATAINAAISAYSMAVTPEASLITFKKSARNLVILGLIGTHAQIAD
jgi:hypothetical protein